MDVLETDFRNFPAWNRQYGEKIPALPGVYFVLDDTQKVYYVGQSRNMRHRYNGHSLKYKIRQIPNVRIAWIIEDNRDKRLLLERRYISHCLPPWNRMDKPRNLSIRQIHLLIPAKLYDGLETLAFHADTVVPKLVLKLLSDAVLDRGGLRMPPQSDKVRINGVLYTCRFFDTTAAARAYAKKLAAKHLLVIRSHSQVYWREPEHAHDGPPNP